MSASEVPESLKSFKKYLIRADQFEVSHPISSYFIRMFVVTKILALPKDPTISAFAGNLLGKLESLKQKPKPEDGYDELRKLALEFYQDAENDEMKNLKTAQTFTTAFLLFEVLDAQFPSVKKDPEDAKKCKYAQQKAVELAKEGMGNPPAVEKKPEISAPEQKFQPAPEQPIKQQVVSGASKLHSGDLERIKSYISAETLLKESLHSVRLTDAQTATEKLEKALKELNKW
jgi:hypothetical protein